MNMPIDGCATVTANGVHVMPPLAANGRPHAPAVALGLARALRDRSASGLDTLVRYVGDDVLQETLVPAGAIVSFACTTAGLGGRLDEVTSMASEVAIGHGLHVDSSEDGTIVLDLRG